MKVLKDQSVPQDHKEKLDQLALQEVREQMAKQERLDLSVLQEAQEFKEQLDQLEIKEMWERLDQLVPQDPQEHKE
jgi:gentisate 1,2-dioxygenase